MPIEMRMWRIDGGDPRPLTPRTLPAERELHEFLLRDPALLGTPLLVIGSEVPTPYGKRLDLLAIDGDGNLHVLELKRDRTPREVVAQILDYGAWVSTLSREDVIDIAEPFLGEPFEAAFAETFGGSVPDEINNGESQMTVVASELDSSSERIVNYLRTFGVPINAVFFSYLEDDGRRYLARSWLAPSDESSQSAPSSGKKSKREPWNGIDWYVSYGDGRSWADARRWGFVSAGGSKFSTGTIRRLPEGARVWVNLPGKGYVGVGKTLGPARRIEHAQVLVDGAWVGLTDEHLSRTYPQGPEVDDDRTEWVVPVEWLATRTESEAYWEKGMFANQNSACALRQRFTLDRLIEHFGVDDEV